MKLNRVLNNRLRLGAWFFLLSLTYISAAMAATAPSLEEVLNLLGIPRQQIDKLNHGEIIFHDIPEATGKELAMSIAIFFPVPFERTVDYIKNGDLLSVDPAITAYQEISPNADVIAFKRFGFTDSQTDEALDLLNAEAGDRFNLSSQEISSFAAIKNAIADTDKINVVEVISQKYREILLQRYQTYRAQGLAGIAAYSRDNGVADPATELRIAAENNKVLAQLFPQIFHGWLNYPEALPNGIEERFYWMNRQVENRPTAILGHHFLLITKTGALMLARQFYVGHSYNSSHLTVGALPFRDGTLVFYGERTSTDQVTGLASGLRHNIGREQMKEQMVKRLKSLGGKLITGSKNK